MTITMLCDRLDPIEMMKGFIQQKTKTPVRALIFSGKKLEEGQTFEECNISKENAHGICTVFLKRTSMTALMKRVSDIF